MSPDLSFSTGPGGALDYAVVKLEYDVTGDGPPLVLLHGLGTSRKTWDDVLPALAKAHRVYRIDLKGFGASPKPENGGYSVFDQAAAVRALTDVTLYSITGEVFEREVGRWNPWVAGERTPRDDDDEDAQA